MAGYDILGFEKIQAEKPRVGKGLYGVTKPKCCKMLQVLNGARRRIHAQARL